MQAVPSWRSSVVTFVTEVVRAQVPCQRGMTGRCSRWPSRMDSSLIYHFKTDHLTIMSEDPISWTRDGEFGGEHNYVELTNIRQKLKIIVPQSHLGSLQVVH